LQTLLRLNSTRVLPLSHALPFKVCAQLACPLKVR